MNNRLNGVYKIVGSGCATVGEAGVVVGIGLVLGALFNSFGCNPELGRRCFSTKEIGCASPKGDTCLREESVVVTSDHDGYRVVDRLLMFFRSQFRFRIVSVNCRLSEVHLTTLVYTHHDQTKLSRSLSLLKGSAGFGILIDTFGIDLVGIDKEALYGISEKKIRYGVVYQFA